MFPYYEYLHQSQGKLKEMVDKCYKDLENLMSLRNRLKDELR